MKIRMRALREFPYANKTLKAGDPFEAETETEANVLAHVGHAERIGEDHAKRSYKRRDMRAEH